MSQLLNLPFTGFTRRAVFLAQEPPENSECLVILKRVIWRIMSLLVAFPKIFPSPLIKQIT